MFPLPLTGRGRIIHEPGWLRPLPGSAAVAPSGSRSDPGHTSSTPGCPTITQHPQGRSTGAGHSHEPGWVRCPLGDASDPLVRLEHSPGSCDGPVSACHEDTRAPWCRQPSQNTGYSLRLLGEPMPRFSRPTITGPHLGVPAAIWRGVLERFKSASTRALRTRCGIDLAGPLVRVRRFRCVSHQLPHGLIPILPAVAAYLPRYHGHRSTRSDPQPAAASNPSYQSPLRDSRPVP